MQSAQGKGFVQPNALLEAAATTSGVVLSATGTIRIVDTASAISAASTATSTATTGFGSGALGSAIPTSNPSIRTRGRGANAPSASDNGAAAPAPSATAVIVEKIAPKTRKDLVEVPYSNRVWRNIVMQYTHDSANAAGKITKMIDPTPLVILGCGSANVGGVKGVEEYYCPPSITSQILRKKGGPYVASIDDIFEAATKSFRACQAVNHAQQIALVESVSSATKGAAATVAAAEELDRQTEAILMKADADEDKKMAYTSYRGASDDDDNDFYSDDDEASGDGGAEAMIRKQKVVTLPMLRPPVAAAPSSSAPALASSSSSTNQPSPASSSADAFAAVASVAGPTMKMVMNHVASGCQKFTYTDYDGVTSGAIVPLIGGTTASSSSAAVGGGGGAASAAVSALLEEDDDGEVIAMDDNGNGSSADKVSAYLNPKAKSNQKYIVKKSELTPTEHEIFEKLWTLWRKGGAGPNSGANSTNNNKQQSGTDAVAAGNKKRAREEDDPAMGKNTDPTAAPPQQQSASEPPQSNSSAAAADDEAEIQRLRRAAEDILAALDRDW